MDHRCGTRPTITCARPVRADWVRRRVPGPAPPVVHGLQIDQALNFQRRFGRVQRWAWWLLALVPVAAIAGLFGDGLFSEAPRAPNAPGGPSPTSGSGA